MTFPAGFGSNPLRLLILLLLPHPSFWVMIAAVAGRMTLAFNFIVLPLVACQSVRERWCQLSCASDRQRVPFLQLCVHRVAGGSAAQSTTHFIQTLPGRSCALLHLCCALKHAIAVFSAALACTPVQIWNSRRACQRLIQVPGLLEPIAQLYKLLGLAQ